MAKRDKNRSDTEWESDWYDAVREEEIRKEREKQRRNKKLNNHKYDVDDWDDVE